MKKQMESVWDNYPNLSEPDFRSLVSVTAQVLLDTQADETEFPNALLSISASAAAQQALPFIKELSPSIEAEDIQRAMEDDVIARRICFAILDELHNKQPVLTEYIKEAFNRRKQMLVAPELLLLVAPLIVLSMKIREIRFENTEEPKSRKIVIKFSESQEAIKAVVTGILQRIRGS